MANQRGKRYLCASCGTEMLVTKAGAGTLACCGQPMDMRAGGAKVGAKPPAGEVIGG